MTKPDPEEFEHDSRSNAPGTLTTPTSPTPSVGKRVIAPVLLLSLGSAVAWRSSTLGLWASLGPGPGFFPLALGIMLIGLAVIWFFQLNRTSADPAALVLSEREAPSLDAAHPQPPHQEPQIPLKRVVIILASLILLALGIDTLGFQLSMLVFLIFHLKVLGRRRWLLTAVVSIAGSFGVFTLFTALLSVPLPAASIPFLRALGL